MITQLWNRVVAATKTKKYLWVPLESGQALASDAGYVRIFISEMWLQTNFSWFNGMFPAVEASVQLKFGDQQAVVFTRVVRPPENATKDGVLRNYEILPLTPFNGGTLELQAALMAMKGENYLGSAIDVLQDFSSLVAVPLGQALAIAEKVSNGLESLVTATNGDARLPYHDAFVGAGMGKNELRPGYIALVRAESDQIDPAQLSVKDGALRYQSEALRAYDYILLRIDCTSTRDDYMQLSSLKTPFDEYVKAMEDSDETNAAVAERRIRGAIFRCAELARLDRARVWDAVNKELAEIKKGFGQAGAQGISARSLDDILATWGVPMAQAQALADQGDDLR